MDVMFLSARWLHIMAAVAAGGGTIFGLMALLPAMQELPDDVRPGFHESVRRRFAGIVMGSISLLLLTGFYNYLVVKAPLHQGQGAYHGAMGVKILLALVVFFIASALVGRSKGLEPIRQKRKLWMTVNVVLVMVIVGLGTYLGAMPHGIK